MPESVAVAECHDCPEIAAGEDMLGWALDHLQETDHRVTAYEPI